MSKKTIHIISFDIPYPPNYGGIVDVYYKILELKKLKIDVILHCFYKDLIDTKHIETLCKEVILYKRKKFNIFNRLPYIVSSRMSSKLITNLKKDKHPILIEGLHCTGFLTKVMTTERSIGLRTHNIEQNYYKGLAEHSSYFWTKMYYSIEAKRIKRYEKKLKNKVDYLFSLSQKDSLHFKETFPKSQVYYTSAYYNSTEIVSESKKHILLQGNFEVNENIIAAKFLIEELAPSQPDEQFVIAGKSAHLHIDTHKLPLNIALFSSPSIKEMSSLNKEAKANIVYSNINAGIKLKILNSLSVGVPVLCNKELYLDPYLKNCVNTYNSITDLNKKIKDINTEYDYRLKLQKNFKTIFNLEAFTQQMVSIFWVE